ncbi:MAG: HD domain-containing protein [Candidatus Pacebacteria bacterium]|nr:HD domain-containing protein [Candidatus Paceibacterota bacterium]
MSDKNLQFLFEIGTLRNMQRGWYQHFGMEVASVMEHSMRVVFLALLIARKEGVKNEEKILKMAIAHDLSETRTSDLCYMQKVYVEEDDKRAIHDLFSGTIFSDFDEKILKEYKERKTIEAKIVKDADNLDIDIELKELEERGSKLPAKLQPTREFVRKTKFYTKTAKKLWDAVQKENISEWHLHTNKWYKIKNAGK